MRNLLLLFVVCVCFELRAQVTEDFSDGNFTSNPTWKGDTANFKVNAGKQLQLNATVAGKSYLSTPQIQTSLLNTTWEFWVKLDLSPSSSNYARVYLASDVEDLSGDLHGYYIQLGEALSADGIDLYRKDGATSVKLIDGIAGHVAKSTNSLRIKITCDATGNWELKSDTLGGTNFLSEGKVSDNTYTSSKAMGVFAEYTKSYVSSFYWDDFSVTTLPVGKDTIPPKLLSAKVLDKNNLELQFNEELDATYASNSTNYSANNGLGNPNTALLNTINKTRVQLTWSSNFTENINYRLIASNIKDVAGNTLNADTVFFTYTIPKTGSIVINEIMADPSPVVGLPDAEYLELYNNTNNPVSLSGWTISDATSTAFLPDDSIGANAYLILTSSANASQFKTYGKTLGVPAYPSLNNDGDSLTLRDNKGNTISQVAYDLSWYTDAKKKDGGWSLERINPTDLCHEGKSGWANSSDTKGGTPGTKNSVFANNTDVIPPKIASVEIVDSLHIKVLFNEKMDASNLDSFNAYSVDKATIKNITSTGFQEVIITFSTALASNQIYKLSVKGLKDCTGNRMQTESIQFGIPSTPDSFDVMVNEILFNPKTGGADFIELFNKSNKIIDVSKLKIASLDDSNHVKTLINACAVSHLMLPSEMVVLTADPSYILNTYHVSYPENLLNSGTLPSMNDDEGRIEIQNENGKVLDRLHYDAHWHFPLLVDVEGVSLEKIRPDLPTQNQTNWHSAASTSGFATPTDWNSQYLSPESEQTGKVSLKEETFSPDGDGYQDVLQILFSPMSTEEWVANVNIFDSRGRKVRTLEDVATIGKQGSMHWDGITDAGKKAPIGIYVILVKLFTLTGKTESYKLACTLAGKI